MPGPAPKPDSERRRRNAPMANTVRLPREGRKGRAPKWPLGGRAARGWADLWKKPQAVMWERSGDEIVVARYLIIRNLIQQPENADQINATALSELRQLEDRLGLSPMARHRLRWEIVEDEVEERRQSKRAASTANRRARLKVVADEA